MEKQKNYLEYEVWGDRACFTRPEFQAERLTYPYITPSAARNIAQSIYWHPGVDYKIEEIEILSPIKTKSIMRRERTDIINNPKVGLQPPTKDKLNTLRTTQYLVDPHYRVKLSFTLTDDAVEKGMTPMKVKSIFNRRLNKGQCYNQPFLGFREFPAIVAPVDRSVKIPDELKGEESREIMIYDFDYNDATGARVPTFYMSHMKDGIVDLEDVRVLR